MSQTLPSVANKASTSTSSQSAGANNAVNNLDVDAFLKLMIAELQHQDPLNPMDSSQMLGQISQMRQITASDKLTSTLNSVLLGQNIASSTNLIGANVTGISDDSENVSGLVSSVSIANGTPKLHLKLKTSAAESATKGGLDKGKYSYRIVWQGDDGKLLGIALSGDTAVTTNAKGESIQINNLPANTGTKTIYRTDATGEGEYQLVGKLTDGNQASFLDSTADDARSKPQTQADTFDHLEANAVREFIVSLNNVGDISPPE